MDGTTYRFDHVLGGHVEFRFSYGYNGDKWYFGNIIRTHAFGSSYVTNGSTGQSYVYVKFYLGYKFPMRPTQSKFIKKIGF